jgi:hypothetical protein
MTRTEIERLIPKVSVAEYDRLPSAHKAVIGGYNAVLTANGWLTVMVVKKEGNRVWPQR